MPWQGSTQTFGSLALSWLRFGALFVSDKGQRAMRCRGLLISEFGWLFPLQSRRTAGLSPLPRVAAPNKFLRPHECSESLWLYSNPWSSHRHSDIGASVDGAPHAGQF